MPMWKSDDVIADITRVGRSRIVAQKRRWSLTNSDIKLHVAGGRHEAHETTRGGLPSGQAGSD